MTEFFHLLFAMSLLISVNAFALNSFSSGIITIVAFFQLVFAWFTVELQHVCETCFKCIP